jgi:endoglucanase
MTKAAGDATSIAVPLNAGTYKLCVVNSQGVKLGESAALLRVGGSGGDGSYVRFRNAATGLYIDGMGSTANGSNACQWSDNDSTNQQWTIINSGGYVLLQNRATGLYLDGMGRTSNGSVCGQWGASGSANQQWTQETVGSYVRFKNHATGLYLDGMGSTANGSALCQWSNSGSANQQWQIE